MNRIFLSLTGLCMAACAHTFAAPMLPPTSTDDTIIVTMPDKSKMIMVVKNKEDLKKFRTYNIDSLIQTLGVYLNQSAVPGADTTLMVGRKGANKSEVMVNVSGGRRTPADEAMIRNRKMLERQLDMLDRQIEMIEKQRNLPQLPASDKANLAKEKENLQQEKENVINELENLKKDLAVRERAEKTVNVRITSTDKDGKTVVNLGDNDAKKLAKKNKPWYNDLNLDLGFNTLVDKGVYQNSAGQEIDYDLKPAGSRYASINWVTGSRIGGPNSPVRLQSGLEANFNNFMFDNDIRIISENNQVVFEKSPISLEKSKLSVTYLSVPVMAGLQFKNDDGKNTFSIMAGGYAGYRIGSHTKIKYVDAEGDTKKDKARGSYNLEDFQYGISASIGYRDFQLFTKYNMSELFKDDRGPQAHVASFGVKFLLD